jgi:hypothetical protein
MSSALAIAGVHPVIDKVNQILALSATSLTFRRSSLRRCKTPTGICRRAGTSERYASRCEREVLPVESKHAVHTTS